MSDSSFLKSATALLLLITGLAAASFSHAEITVVYPKAQRQSSPHQTYPIAVLERALALSGKDYRIKASNGPMTQKRALSNLQQGVGLNVAWSMTSLEREKRLLPVRIPIHKGLIGWRIPLIRSLDQGRFRRIESARQLQTKRAGQGHDWPDTSILRANRYDVVGSSNYRGLFKLLTTRRIDWFPRSILEVWPEAEANADEGIAVEKKLMVLYPTAFYFFVNKKSAVLAKDIRFGLELMIENGEFDAMLMEQFRDRLLKAKLAERTIFRLDNPLLSPETPLDRPELWLQPEDFMEQ